jgi:hypothetical protein
MICHSTDNLLDDIHITHLFDTSEEIDEIIDEIVDLKFVEMECKFVEMETDNVLSDDEARSTECNFNLKPSDKILHIELPHKKIIVGCKRPDNKLLAKLAKYKHIALTLSTDEKKSPLTIEDVVVAAKCFLCKDQGCDYIVSDVKLEIINNTKHTLEINVSYYAST